MVFVFCRRQKDNKQADNAKVNEHDAPPSEPAKPDEPVKQESQDNAPERVLQIDDPNAVHVDGEDGGWGGGEGGRGRERERERERWMINHCVQT